MSNIPGTNVSAPVVPFDTADTFPTHDAQYGKGGYRSVATAALRDAIPDARKTEGMRVRVTADPTPSNNGDWDWFGGIWLASLAGVPDSVASTTVAAINVLKQAATDSASASEVSRQASGISATASEESRQASLTQAGISTTQAGLAATAKTAAEAARDASFVTGPKYATEALGRAAVADGINFLVQGAGDVAALEYRRINAGTVSTLIATYPSKAAVDALGQVFDNTAFTFQGYVTNGVYYDNATYRATDYLRIEGGATYTATAYMQGTLTHDWYDANKAYISSFASAEATLASVTATAPSNARFVRLSTTASAGMGPTVGLAPATQNINIAKVLKIVSDNPPTIPSENATHAGSTVKVKLDSVDATQAFLLSKQNDLLNELDLITDASSPFFMNTWAYTKSGVTPSTQVEVAIVSRVSDDTFAVGANAGVNLPGAGGAVVVKDAATGRHYSFGVKSNASDTITVFGTLPATLSVCQTMHDAVNGQHLSRLGYKGLADFIVDCTQKFSYKKKKPLFVYHAPTSSTPVFSNPDIYKLDNATKIVDMALLGAAGNGGWVAGTSNLGKSCGQAVSDIGAAAYPLSTYVSRAYVLNSGAAGDGYEFKFTAYGANGFIELPVGVTDTAYTNASVNYRCTGRARVQVIGDGVTSFLDQICDVGKEHFLYASFSGATEITVRITCMDATPTVIHLHGAYAYQKSPETPTTGYFKSGDVVAFLGDSWTQFPSAVGGETLPLRPDGSTGDGMQFLSVRLNERLAADGVSITTLNMGRGGQTSAWGLYWVSKILELTPKPTHCIVSFYINDYNSGGAAVSSVDTAYDFDPVTMFNNKFQSAGGKKGAVTPDQWYANLQSICATLLRSGIKPIVMMPGHTASIAQTQSIQQAMLNKIAPGFNNFNEEGGRE